MRVKMKNETINTLLMRWMDRIPKNSVPTLSKELQNVPEDKAHSFSTLSLKNPAIGLLLCFTLWGSGADRFYKGDIGLGITKLLMIAMPLFYFKAFDWMQSISMDLCQLLSTSIIFLPIWLLVSFLDIFLVWNGIKADNLEKIQNLIDSL